MSLEEDSIQNFQKGPANILIWALLDPRQKTQLSHAVPRPLTYRTVN